MKRTGLPVQGRAVGVGVAVLARVEGPVPLPRFPPLPGPHRIMVSPFRGREPAGWRSPVRQGDARGRSGGEWRLAFADGEAGRPEMWSARRRPQELLPVHAAVTPDRSGGRGDRPDSPEGGARPSPRLSRHSGHRSDHPLGVPADYECSGKPCRLLTHQFSPMLTYSRVLLQPVGIRRRWRACTCRSWRTRSPGSPLGTSCWRVPRPQARVGLGRCGQVSR